MGSPTSKILGLGAAGAAFWLAKQSMSNMHFWHEKAANHHVEMQRGLMEFQHSNWSGYPGLDALTNKIRSRAIVIKGIYHEYKALVEGFVNDVILGNALEITLMLGGLYLFAGKQIGAVLRHGGNALGRVLSGPNWGNGMVTLGKGLVGGAVKLLDYGVVRPLRSGPGGWALLGILGFGLFKFHRVYTGMESDDRFRTELLRPQHGGGGH